MPEPTVVAPNPPVVDPAAGKPPAPVVPPVVPPATFDWGTVDPAFKEAKSLHKFAGKTEKDLLKAVGSAYVELDKSVGSMVRIPGPDAKPEEIAAFNEKRGVPKDLAGYPDAVSLGLVPEAAKEAWDAAAEGKFRARAHKLGLTPEQYKGVMEGYIENATDMLTVMGQGSHEEIRAGQEALIREWGGNYKRNLALAQRTTQSFDGPDKAFSRFLETEFPGPDGKPMRLGNHPAYLSWAARVGEAMLEGNFISGEDLTTSKADAQKELDTITKNLIEKSSTMTREERMAVTTRQLELRRMLENIT